MEQSYNHPPMSRFEKRLIWLVGLGFCVSTWVHWIIPGLKALRGWMEAL